MPSICIIEDVEASRMDTKAILLLNFPQEDWEFQLLTTPVKFKPPSSLSVAPKIVISDLWFGVPGYWDEWDVKRIVTKFIPLILTHVIYPLNAVNFIMDGFMVYSKYKDYSGYTDQRKIDNHWLQDTLGEMKRINAYKEIKAHDRVGLDFDKLQSNSFVGLITSFEDLITSTLQGCGINENRIFSKWTEKGRDDLVSAVKQVLSSHGRAEI